MSQDPVQTNKHTYQQVAAKFSALSTEMPSQVIERAERLVATLPDGGLVLDLGCGPGRDLAWFHSKGVRVIGADLTLGMLEQARLRGDFPLYEMDLRRLAFADGCFTAVWCNAALLHLPKVELPGALSEIARILIPDGHFFCSVQQGSGEGLESSALWDNLPRFFARYDPTELAEFLQQAGFLVLQQDSGHDDKRPEKTWLWYEAIK